MPAEKKQPRRLRLERPRRELHVYLADFAGRHDLTVQDALELLCEQQLGLAGRLQATSVRRGD